MFERARALLTPLGTLESLVGGLIIGAGGFAGDVSISALKRDLGIKDGTKGDYVAHVIRANGKKQSDEVQQWHIHECDFQLVYVLNGWATFEYEGQGEHTIRKGDCILQTPMIKHREIACSEDFEVLEIVSPANFATKVVEAPAVAAE